MKVKKVSDFDLFDTCAWLIHVSQNKKWIDIIIIHTHFSKNLKTLKKTSNLKISFFLRLAFFEKYKAYEISKIEILKLPKLVNTDSF